MPQAASWWSGSGGRTLAWRRSCRGRPPPPSGALAAPVFEGLRSGFSPHYNESPGFATVAMMALTPVGIAWGWRLRSSPAIALALLGVVTGAAVYGPLAPFLNRVPVLSSSATSRMTVI